MAIVRVYDFPAGTLEQYDQVMARFDNQIAPGNLLHAAGATDHGFRALDVYESREAADQISELVADAAAGAGLQAPIVSEFETHNLLRA
jgi:hypothetical protein